MKNLKKSSIIVTIISFLTFFSSANAEIKVVASIKPIHSLASYLMDGVTKPKLIVDGYSSPHGFALKPSHAKMLQEADIIFYVAGGLLGFVSGPIQSASRTLLVFLADEKQITESFGLYALVGRATAFLAPALITWFTLASGSQQIGLVPIIILLFIGWYLLRFVNVKNTV